MEQALLKKYLYLYGENKQRQVDKIFEFEIYIDVNTTTTSKHILYLICALESETIKHVLIHIQQRTGAPKIVV